MRNKKLEIPVVQVAETAGLTAIEQLVDNTSNEIFSFQDSTSKTEKKLIIYPLKT